MEVTHPHVEWNLFTLTSAHVPLRSSLKETF